MTYGTRFSAFVRSKLSALGLTTLGRVNAETLASWADAFHAQENAQAELFPTTNSVQISSSLVVKEAKRDELFEAVAGVCGIRWQELTKSARGPLNAAVGELRAIGATPEEVRRRAILFQNQYPALRMTPTALIKHWASFPNVAPVSSISEGPRLIFEPKGWREWIVTVYSEESWCETALALGWSGITHTMRAKIARECQQSAKQNHA